MIKTRRLLRHVLARGFSLVEMAIVLAILGLLLGGSISLIGAQIEQQRVKDAQRMLEDIREALMGHAVRTGRLPCPAVPTTASGAAGAGTERLPTDVGCTGGALQGVVPWATLGLPETDPWGRRFTYRVSAAFARNLVASPQAAFTLTTNGDMNIRATTGGTILASTIPAVVISHGPNGWRAFTPAGNQMGNSPDADEQENFAASATDFISKTPTATYDDLTVWVTPTTLANRMIQAQRLP